MRPDVRGTAQVALRAIGFAVKKADVLELLLKTGLDEKERLDYAEFKMVGETARELVAIGQPGSSGA